MLVDQICCGSSLWKSCKVSLEQYVLLDVVAKVTRSSALRVLYLNFVFIQWLVRFRRTKKNLLRARSQNFVVMFSWSLWKIFYLPVYLCDEFLQGIISGMQVQNHAWSSFIKIYFGGFIPHGYKWNGTYIAPFYSIQHSKHFLLQVSLTQSHTHTHSSFLSFLQSHTQTRTHGCNSGFGILLKDYWACGRRIRDQPDWHLNHSNTWVTGKTTGSWEEEVVKRLFWKSFKNYVVTPAQ